MLVASSDTTGFSEESEDLTRRVIATITETVIANGISSEEARTLAGAIYDRLDSKSLVGNSIEYGLEDVNRGNIVKCDESIAEYIHTVSEWAPYNG